jgi:hypothetical protein
MFVRIGIWFDTSHVPYGGPAHLLLGTILGFYQANPNSVLLLNEVGDYNWLFSMIPRLQEYKEHTRGYKNVAGPMIFNAGDALTSSYETNPIWQLGEGEDTLYLAPSLWYARWLTHGFPFYDLEHKRPMVVWGGGVNTERFTPLPKPVQLKHDYFIYFKSQNWDSLRVVYDYLFHNYFKRHGPVLTYYFYSTEELLEAAQNSKFCIVLGGTETQGLASLEIMSCGCPLFVLDTTEFVQDGVGMSGATSVTCWDSSCGMKSSLETMKTDFPVFLEHLETYRPREFVEREYSWKASAGKLLHYMSLVSP